MEKEFEFLHVYLANYVSVFGFEFTILKQLLQPLKVGKLRQVSEFILQMT